MSFFFGLCGDNFEAAAPIIRFSVDPIAAPGVATVGSLTTIRVAERCQADCDLRHGRVL
jgi:hypothetical protein